MKFQFPGTYAELRDQNYSDHYRVQSINQIPQMEERWILIKINQFIESFTKVPNLIEEPREFDFFYHLIEFLASNPNQKVQLQLIENFTFQIQKLNGQYQESFHRTLFLLLNLLQQKNIQGQQTRRALKTLSQLFFSNAYAELHREGSRYMFDIVKMAAEIKEQGTREIWIETLIKSVLLWEHHTSNLKNAIVHLMYESEAVLTNLGKFLVACSQNEKTNAYATEQIILLMNYITENSTNQTESLAVKNLRELFSSTSKEMPKFYYHQMSVLIGLYNNENYHLRNGLSDLIANVIEYLVKNRSENEESYTTNAKKLLEHLIDRDLDKTAHCRSNVLQNLSQLLLVNCVPKEFLERIFCISSQRLKDISGFVRKASLQLLKSILRYQRRLYVQSQGAEMFFSLEEIDNQIKENQKVIEELQKEFLDLEKQFKEGTLAQEEFEDSVAILKNKAAEAIMKEEYLEKYKRFILNMRQVQTQVFQLCASKNQTDVLHSIKLFAYLKKYQFDQSDIGFKRMLLLVWSQDKAISAEVIKKFWKIYLRDTRNTKMIILSIIDLIRDSNQKEIISIEKILLTIETENAPNYKFPAKTFHILWDYLGNTEVDQKSALIFIRIMLTRNPSYLTSNKVEYIDQALQLYRQGNPEWTIIKELAIIIQKLDQKDEQNKRPLERAIDSFMILLIKYVKTKDPKYFSACDSIIELVSLDENKEFLYDTLIQELRFKKSNTPIEIEETKKLDEAHLSHIIYIAGCISIQYLIMIDDTHTKFRKEKEEIEKSLDKAEEIYKVQMQGGVEGKYEKLHQSLDLIQNTQLIQNNLLSVFSTIIKQIVNECLSQMETEENINKQQPPLVQVSLLTMCKFMCLSQKYCEENLHILFQITHSSIADQTMKNNVIISMGDLLHRWPNIIMKFQKQVYQNLRDPCFQVRKVTLQVLTHLILNDMLKSQISLSYIPQLLSDPSPQIQSMTKYFLNELFKKEPKAISNALPDICGRVYEQNEQIFQLLAQYVDKSNQETIVDNLITILGNSKDPNEIRNVALVFPIINFSATSLQKLLNGWEEYRPQLKDQFVYNQFVSLIKKAKRILPQEAKSLIDEYEFKVENHDKETFDGRRREKVSKKKNVKQQNEQTEQQQQQENEIRGGTKQSKRRQRKKKEEDFMELESDDEEQSEESIIIKKQPTRRRGRNNEQEQ